MAMLPTVQLARSRSASVVCAPTQARLLTAESDPRSVSAPESRRQSQTPSLAASEGTPLPVATPALLVGVERGIEPMAAGSATRAGRTPSAATLRMRAIALRTPPPPVKFTDPLACRRGLNAMGHGRVVNRSLSRMDVGGTAFGMPRWEQPRAPLADPRHEAALSRGYFLKPPPASPLRRYRRHATSHAELPRQLPRLMRGA
jgi:hypothetical protein